MAPFSPARDALADLLRRRIAVAPMAGGPTTTELVVAAARAGALGWLAAGYKTPEAMAAEIAAVRAATAEPFGVNVFVPGAPYPDRRTLAGYLDSLGPGLGDASWDDDGFDGKVAALLTDPPAVTSFTFGCPGAPGRGQRGGDHRDEPRRGRAGGTGRRGRALRAGLRGRRAPGDVRERRRARARPWPARADRRGLRGHHAAADRGGRHHGLASGSGCAGRGRG